MTRLAAVALLIARCLCGEDAVSIRFRAVVGDRELACGRSYAGLGATKSTITPQDFRFYVHNARLVDEAGREVEIDLRQDGKWQLDDVALLDFEDASGACSNGTPETNRGIVGTVTGGGRYRGLRWSCQKLSYTVVQFPRTGKTEVV